MANDVYETPSSELSDGPDPIEFNFGTLNIWRKIYLILVWLSTLGLIAIMLLGASETSDGLGTGLIVLICAIPLAITYWTHWAICKREKGHLLALAIINLFPGLNLIGCLIMVWIRSVSVKEIERNEAQNTV